MCQVHTNKKFRSSWAEEVQILKLLTVLLIYYNDLLSVPEVAPSVSHN